MLHVWEALATMGSGCLCPTRKRPELAHPSELGHEGRRVLMLLFLEGVTQLNQMDRCSIGFGSRIRSFSQTAGEDE